VPQRLIAAQQNGELSVPIRVGAHRFHRDLPESAIWGYDGAVPGPTIEAERGQPVTVRWRNELAGALPVVVTTAPTAADASGVPVQCVPGLSGGRPDPNAAALSGYTVVHLHGGLTPASYDGWAENLFAPGQDAVFHYPMGQRAALGVTRFGVYAGLAGLWIIRDRRERELGLPEGPPFEVPLLLQDRNFGLDGSGLLTGQLVHKTDPEVMEAFPPFTVVNGKVWPLLEVQPATYRFRVLNGSNARTYRLVPVRGGEPELHRVTQIGTDHGLLRTPARVPPDGLVLASAERADLLVDFSDLAPGTELTLLNTAAAPFDGAPVAGADGQRLPELAAGGDGELCEDLGQVVLDSARAEEQLGGDLRVGQIRPAGHQRHADAPFWPSVRRATIRSRASLRGKSLTGWHRTGRIEIRIEPRPGAGASAVSRCSSSVGAPCWCTLQHVAASSSRIGTIAPGRARPSSV
jgi:spore coat protein A